MEVIKKPWGTEEILAVEDRYVVKRIHMLEDKRCSLQYHKRKTETIYVIEGKLLLTFNDDELVLIPGEFKTIPPMMKHRMKALDDTVYIECSTTELDDVERIEDDYGR